MKLQVLVTTSHDDPYNDKLFTLYPLEGYICDDFCVGQIPGNIKSLFVLGK